MQQQEKVARMIEELSKLGYTMQDLADLVRSLKNVYDEEGVENKLYQEDELVDRITELLKEIGIPMGIYGFQYLRKGLYILVEYQHKCKKNMQLKELYVILAKEYNVTYMSVNRAIFVAVTNGLKNIDPDVYMNYFGNVVSSNGTVTVKTFLATITDYLLLEGF